MKNVENAHRRVLVAQNDAESESIIRRVLSQIVPDAEIDWVASAIDGEKRIADGTYSLVITDVYLRGEDDGLDLWKKIESLSPKTSVLFISDLPVSDFLAKVPEEFACPNYLSKPLHEGEFKQVIEGLLSYPDEEKAA